MLISVITIAKTWGSEVEDTIKQVSMQCDVSIQHIIKIGSGLDKDITKGISKLYPNLTILSSPDSGIYHALNLAISHVSGELIIFLHVGDNWRDKFFLKRVKTYFENDPSLDLVYGNVTFCKDNVPSRIWRSTEFRRWKLYFGWMPPHTSVTARSRVYKKVGKFDQNFKISGDYEWLIRAFSLKNLNTFYMENLTIFMETGGASENSLKNIAKKFQEDFYAVRNKKLFGFGTVIFKRLIKSKQFLQNNN